MGTALSTLRSGRVLQLAALTALSCTIAAFGQSRAKDKTSAELEVPADAKHVRLGDPSSHSAAAELLRKHVDKVDWSDTTLEEIMDWLRDQGNDRVNIIARWASLNAEGVNADKTVTLQLRNTTVGAVLIEVVDQLSEDGLVSFRAVGDSLRISTKQDFEKKMEFRVYDVTDIIFKAPDMGRSAPTIDLNQAARSGGGSGGGGGGGGQSVFGGGSSGNSAQDLEEQESVVKERMDALRLIIIKTIAPETWGEADGGGGRGIAKAYANRQLVILNTIEVHEMVAGFFSFDQ